jgi:oligosaccharide repeat unit polymerase
VFLVIPVLSSLSFIHYKKKIYITDSVPSLYNIKLIGGIWFFFVSVEIIFFGIFPFFGFFGVPVKHYTDWGFHGFHGLLNGILMAYTIINYGFYIKTKNKKYLKIFFICLLWPILLVTRQMLMSILIQCFFVYYYLGEFQIKRFFKVIGISLFTIFLFGVIGDMRSGPGAINYLASPTENYPDFLPSGFLWVYVYLVSPINNIIFNFYNYPLFQFSVSDAFGGLLPSSIRSMIFTSTDADFELVNKFLNVSSCHKRFLAGFGIAGSLIYQLFISFIITIFYTKFKYSNNIKYVFIITVLAHNVAMSFFVDFFTSLVFISEICFVYLFFSKIRFK